MDKLNMQTTNVGGGLRAMTWQNASLWGKGQESSSE